MLEQMALFDFLIKKTWCSIDAIITVLEPRVVAQASILLQAVLS